MRSRRGKDDSQFHFGVVAAGAGLGVEEREQPDWQQSPRTASIPMKKRPANGLAGTTELLFCLRPNDGTPPERRSYRHFALLIMSCPFGLIHKPKQCV